MMRWERPGLVLLMVLVAQRAAAQETLYPAEVMSPAHMRAALDSIEAPECPPAAPLDSTELERVTAPDGGVSWLMPRGARAPVEPLVYPPGFPRYWRAAAPGRRELNYLSGSSRAMARRSFPLSVLLDQYSRKGGVPSPHRCYDCTQPIRLCRVPDAEHRAWIASGEGSGWSWGFMDMLIVESGPDRWHSVGVVADAPDDAVRWAIVRSVRVNH